MSFAARSSAQADTSSSTLVFPVVFFLPETRWGFGAAGAHNFYIDKSDSISPPSQVQLGFAYTQNRQILAYLPFNFFWDERQWQVTGELGWYRYSYNFYGVGNDVDPSFEESYPIEFPRFRVHAINKITGPWYVGGRYWADYFTIDAQELDPNGLLVEGVISGSRGGAVMGGGVSLAYDTRDNVYSSKTGGFVELVWQDHSSFWLGDFNFSKYRFDLRGFYNLKEKFVLAGQVLGIHSTGDVPFNHMGFVGGSRINRGYYEGRYRDKTMLSAQGEFRFPIWRKFDGVLFGSKGAVGPNLQALTIGNSHHSGGGGLRYTIDEEKGVKLRLDYAFSEHGTGLYLTFGEAF